MAQIWRMKSDPKFWVESILQDNEDSKVARFAPEGGGFIHEMPMDEFLARFEPVPSSEVRRPWQAALVFGDWGEEETFYPCYTTGARWNGWATPFFEKEAALKVAEASQLEFDPKTDKFLLPASEYAEAEEWEAEIIQTADGPKKVWGIGAFSWCWMLED